MIAGTDENYTPKHRGQAGTTLENTDLEDSENVYLFIGSVLLKSFINNYERAPHTSSQRGTLTEHHRWSA